MVDEYIPFVIGLVFWVGVSFETPLIMAFLARMEVVTAEQFLKAWKFAVIAIAAAGWLAASGPLLADPGSSIPADSPVADALHRAERSVQRIVEVSADRPEHLVALDDALDDLQKTRPELGRIVELRFFGGFRNEEIAELVEISIPTITRRWQLARAWLYRRLTAAEGDGG